MRESVIYQEIRSDGIEEGRKNEALLSSQTKLITQNN